MDIAKDAPHQIEKIRLVFQQALKVATEGLESEIQEHLITANIEFRAVAYEAIAMGLALKDLSTGTLQHWRAFMRSSDPQWLAHIHVGLGWAVAKQKISSLVFLETLNPLMLFRVVDGFGYYEGIFRLPQSIYAKTRSEAIIPEAFKDYDQGLGPSIWYNCNGDSEKVAMIIHSFPPERLIYGAA